MLPGDLAVDLVALVGRCQEALEDVARRACRGRRLAHARCSFCRGDLQHVGERAAVACTRGRCPSPSSPGSRGSRRSAASAVACAARPAGTRLACRRLRGSSPRASSTTLRPSGLAPGDARSAPPRISSSRGRRPHEQLAAACRSRVLEHDARLVDRSPPHERARLPRENAPSACAGGGCPCRSRAPRKPARLHGRRRPSCGVGRVALKETRSSRSARAR